MPFYHSFTEGAAGWYGPRTFRAAWASGCVALQTRPADFIRACGIPPVARANLVDCADQGRNRRAPHVSADRGIDSGFARSGREDPFHPGAALGDRNCDRTDVLGFVLEQKCGLGQ